MSTDFPTAPLASGHKGAGGGAVEKSPSASHTKNLTLPVEVAKTTGEITQNVNFAINATILQAFLDSSGTQYRTAPLGKRQSASDIAERAKQFTALIECY